MWAWKETNGSNVFEDDVESSTSVVNTNILESAMSLSAVPVCEGAESLRKLFGSVQDEERKDSVEQLIVQTKPRKKQTSSSITSRVCLAFAVDVQTFSGDDAANSKLLGTKGLALVAQLEQGKNWRGKCSIILYEPENKLEIYSSPDDLPPCFRPEEHLCISFTDSSKQIWKLRFRQSTDFSEFSQFLLLSRYILQQPSRETVCMELFSPAECHEEVSEVSSGDMVHVFVETWTVDGLPSLESLLHKNGLIKQDDEKLILEYPQPSTGRSLHKRIAECVLGKRVGSQLLLVCSVGEKSQYLVRVKVLDFERRAEIEETESVCSNTNSETIAKDNRDLESLHVKMDQVLGILQKDSSIVDDHSSNTESELDSKYTALLDQFQESQRNKTLLADQLRAKEIQLHELRYKVQVLEAKLEHKSKETAEDSCTKRVEKLKEKVKELQLRILELEEEQNPDSVRNAIKADRRFLLAYTFELLESHFEKPERREGHLSWKNVLKLVKQAMKVSIQEYPEENQD